VRCLMCGAEAEAGCSLCSQCQKKPTEDRAIAILCHLESKREPKVRVREDGSLVYQSGRRYP